MLPKSNRFSFRKGYPRNIRQTPLFVVRYQKNETVLHAAIVVGKKIDSKATGRNKIKRLFTQVLEKHIDKNTPLDLVIILKPKILTADSDTILKQLKEALAQIY